MLSQRRSQRRTVPTDKRKKYLACLNDAQKIPFIESQIERMDVLDGVLTKYNMLSESDEPAPSTSTTEGGHEVGTDERYLMSLVSKTSHEAFHRILSDFTVVPSVFSLYDFADKLQPAEGARYFDWDQLEAFASTVLRTPGNLNTCWQQPELLLEVEERAAKRQRITRKHELEPAKKIVPNSVVNEDAKKVEEYRVLNKSLRQSFSANRQRPVDFFELVVDKQSYPTTVENIFNFAFLIREDMAKLNISNDGMPKVEPVVEDREEGRRKKREQESNQMILSLDHEKWKKIIKHLEKMSLK